MRLLVIEDDGALSGALRDGLAGQGFAVDTAGTAGDARARLHLDAYDCIVLDLGLPDQDGGAFLRDLRAAQLGDLGKRREQGWVASHKRRSVNFPGLYRLRTAHRGDTARHGSY